MDCCVCCCISPFSLFEKKTKKSYDTLVQENKKLKKELKGLQKSKLVQENKELRKEIEDLQSNGSFWQGKDYYLDYQTEKLRNEKLEKENKQLKEDLDISKNFQDIDNTITINSSNKLDKSSESSTAKKRIKIKFNNKSYIIYVKEKDTMSKVCDRFCLSNKNLEIQGIFHFQGKRCKASDTIANLDIPDESELELE